MQNLLFSITALAIIIARWNVRFPCAQFGDTFNLPLLVEYTAEQQAFYNVLEELFAIICNSRSGKK